MELEKITDKAMKEIRRTIQESWNGMLGSGRGKFRVRVRYYREWKSRYDENDTRVFDDYESAKFFYDTLLGYATSDEKDDDYKAMNGKYGKILELHLETMRGTVSNPDWENVTSGKWK